MVSGTLLRYRCPACGRTFSERTFSIDYYTKKTIDYDEILERQASGESMSAMARNLHCSSNSLENRIERLGRNALVLQERLQRSRPLAEDLVADGFESFDTSQYFPNNINILVGKESQNLYAFSHATIRRKGCMTKKQAEKRTKIERTWKAPVGSLKTSFSLLVKEIPKVWDQSAFPRLILSTDEHNTYPLCIRGVPQLSAAMKNGAFVHSRYSSKAERTVNNPLFSVNYYDRELRKDIAAYRRESTCFCRNVSNGMLRFSVYAMWHNFRKPHRIGVPGETPPVHGIVSGIDQGRVAHELRRALTERAFLSRTPIGEEPSRIWHKRAPTPRKTRPDWIPKYVQTIPQGSEN
jgi:hypothetical protein